MDILFVIDMILNFFHEYVSDNSHVPVRSLPLIAERYITGDFIFDLLVIIPFYSLFLGEELNNQLKLFFLIKLLRLKRANDLFQPGFFKNFITALFDRRLKKMIQTQHGKDQHLHVSDHTKILTQIKLNFFFRILRLSVVMLLTS